MSRIYNRNDQVKTRQRLRNDLTSSERMLWSVLRGNGLNDVKFRRQYGVGPFVVDFYAPSARLAIEIDGDSHFSPGEEMLDRKRQDYIEGLGIAMLRFTNLDVKLNLDEVVFQILRRLDGNANATTSPNPSLVRKGNSVI